jgi:hypothetical protein
MGVRFAVLMAVVLGGAASPAVAQTPLAVPGATEGALPGASDYAVTLAAGQAYRFLLSSNDFDPMLELVGPGGAKLAEDDDGGGGLNAQIVHVARASGTYRLRLLSNPEGGAGRYTLVAVTTEAPRPPTVEAAVLAPGRPVDAALGGAGDPPFRVYRLRLAANQILTATMDAAEGSELDPLLELRPANAGADASPLARDDDGGERFNARLTFVAPEAGDYHLYARQAGRGAGGFRLAMTVATANPRPVADLTPGRPERHELSAANASRAPEASAARSRPGLFHAYRLNGRAGQSYTIDLKSSAFDALLEVVGDTAVGRSVIARDDDGGQGTDARLTLAFVRDETVDVRALSLDGKEGEYELTVTGAAP